MNQHISNDRTVPIRAAARLTGVEEHTLRYWEREFPEYLNPSRTVGGQRRYAPNDLRAVLHIRKLLHEDKFSIAGARQFLQRLRDAA